MEELERETTNAKSYDFAQEAIKESNRRLGE